MIIDDPGILCFQHTEDEDKVYCFKFPAICEFCDANLLTSELLIPPFRVPYPFKQAYSEENVLVIKPTVGDFLNNYENSSDLHIGVTDSEGFVIEYDRNGLRRSKSEDWDQCLPVRVLQNKSRSMLSHWDDVLYETFLQDCWTPERYNAENHNCYSFVMSFLTALNLKELDPFIYNKVIFCRYFVTPQSRIASKYIGVYRKLKEEAVV